MKIIVNDKSTCIFFDGEYYDTNKIYDLPFEKAVKMRNRFPGTRFLEKEEPVYNPDLWKLNKTFGFTGNVDRTSGWGNVSYNLLKYSGEYDVRWNGILVDTPIDRVMSKVMNKPMPSEMAMVYHEQPKDYWLDKTFGRTIGILPFETTQVPSSWVPKINALDGVLVPCHQNVGMMRNSGVRIPVEVIHWGIDKEKFYPLERKNNRVFTFGTSGALSRRKGTDLLVEAFSKAFPRNITDVRLLAKTSYTHFQFWNKDPRIKINMSPVSHEEMIEEFYEEIDCFVYPTRGEGFGLTPLEAMATGVPAITTDWSGPTEYNNNEVGWMLGYSMVPAYAFSDPKTGVYKEYCGEWAEPNLDQLVNLLRYCYEHQDEVKEKGKLAAEYVAREWTWEEKIKLFHEALGKLL